MKNQQNGDRRAAIVCSHIAENNLPILRAVRDEPEMDEDSGWQFLCGVSGEEDPEKARVWLVCEVIDNEPSLADYMELPPGTVVTRANSGESWKIGHK
jgi:hypothetical protein